MPSSLRLHPAEAIFSVVVTSHRLFWQFIHRVERWARWRRESTENIMDEGLETRRQDSTRRLRGLRGVFELEMGFDVKAATDETVALNLTASERN